MEKHLKDIFFIESELRGKKKKERHDEITDLRKQVDELTNKFYTTIPHNFGRRRPVPILSLTELKDKIQMLDLMADMRRTAVLLAQKSVLLHPFDFWYQHLGAGVKQLEANTPTFDMIQVSVTITRKKKKKK